MGNFLKPQRTIKHQILVLLLLIIFLGSPFKHPFLELKWT